MRVASIRLKNLLAWDSALDPLLVFVQEKVVFDAYYVVVHISCCLKYFVSSEFHFSRQKKTYFSNLLSCESVRK